MTKDPICRMTVDEATALQAERDRKTFYFCSEHCRQKFLSTPPGAKPEGKSGSCCGKHPRVARTAKFQLHPAINPAIKMRREMDNTWLSIIPATITIAVAIWSGPVGWLTGSLDCQLGGPQFYQAK